MTSLPGDMTGDPLVRELNRRFGLIGQCFGEFSVPYNLPYSASIAIVATAATYYLITATSGAAFLVNFPSALAPGQPIILDFVNASGGVLGAVTFGAGFLLAGAFVAPANGKRRVYAFLATDIRTLVEQYRSPTDVG